MRNDYVERLIEEIVELTTEEVGDYRYDRYALERRLGFFARQCAENARKDEIERIQHNTLDADTDVWSRNDSGQLVSLTDRYNALG